MPFFVSDRKAVKTPTAASTVFIVILPFNVMVPFEKLSLLIDPATPLVPKWENGKQEGVVEIQGQE